MSNDQKRICMYCRWWKMNDLYSGVTDAEMPVERRAGECRVSPPIPILAPARAVTGAWPQSFGEDWCGSFADRPDNHIAEFPDAWEHISEPVARVIENSSLAYERLNGGSVCDGSKRHRSSKLTPEDVAIVRSLPSRVTNQQLSDLFGVSRRCISDARTGVTWREIGAKESAMNGGEDAA